MAIALYPAIVERAGKSFSVFFPDLPGCTSAGATVQEAVLNAEEALSGHLLECARHGDEFANASDIGEIEHDPEVDEVARVLVRAELPGKVKRINITLDEGLIAAIDKVAPNRSGFIAEAARDELKRRREYA